MEKNVQISYDAETIAKSDEMIDPKSIKELRLLAGVQVKFETEIASISRSLSSIVGPSGVPPETPELAQAKASFLAYGKKIRAKFTAELTAIMKREIERNGN